MDGLAKRLESVVLAIPRWFYRRVVAEQQTLDRREEQHRAAIRDTLAQMAEAMRHDELAWKGQATYHAEADGIAASAIVGSRAREVNDEVGRNLVETWRKAFVDADMKYRRGEPPPGLEELRAQYEAASDSLGALLRSWRPAVAVGLASRT